MIQATRFCNINCDYCYLPFRAAKDRFDLDTFNVLFPKLTDAGLLSGNISIVWHAGEPMVLPPHYYEAAFERVRALTPADCTITHFFQTNGTLLNQSYCDLIKSHEVRIGVSVDGPAFIHDKHRKTRSGSGTHAATMKGVRLLQQNGIQFSIIAVITSDSLDYPDQIYDFFRELGATDVGLNIDEIEGDNQSSSMSTGAVYEKYEAFLRRIMQRMMEDAGAMRIREFNQALEVIAGALLGGRAPGSTESNPLSILSVDTEGRLFTYSPELVDAHSAAHRSFSFGSVSDVDFINLYSNPLFRSLDDQVQEGVRLCEQSCGYFSVCGGGAPANKIFENGTFASTETMFCRLKKKALVDVVEDYIVTSLQQLRAGRKRGSKEPTRGRTLHSSPMTTILSPSSREKSRTPRLEVTRRGWTVLRPANNRNACLRSGIPIVSKISLEERLRISDGTAPPRDTGLQPEKFKPGARVPRPNWTTLTPTELVIVTGDPSAAGCVGLVQLPSSVTKPLLTAGELLAKAADDSERANVLRSYSVQIQASVAQIIQLYGDPAEEARYLGIGTNAPGDPTITIDPQDGLHIGLHFDSWSQLSHQDRAKAPNRICVNVGAESRNLVFLNQPLPQILADLTATGVPFQHLSLTDIGRLFMRQFPDYPVISLRIDPGEAYIAPTENIIHDGSSREMSTLDIPLTILGRFHLA